MSIPGLLERGIAAVLAEVEAAEELRELVTAAGHDEDAVEHVRQTLEAMPALLVAVTRDLSSKDRKTRHLFNTVLDYLLTEDNLIPSHAGKPLLGLLDDVYLVHVAAIAVQDRLGRVDMRSVTGGADLLEQILPRDVTGKLRDIVREAKA